MFVATVEDKIVAGAVSVGTFEAVQHGVCPLAAGLRRHFEDYAAGASRISARRRGAVKIAQVVEGHATDGCAPIFLGIRKVVQNGLFPLTSALPSPIQLRASLRRR
jgi:hypothetical protein